VAAGPWFVVGSRCLHASVASQGWLLIATPRIPRACRAATDPADGLRVSVSEWSFDLGDRPAEAGELAGGRDGDDRAALRALLEACPDAVQASLRRPGDGDRFRRLAVLALGQGLADLGSLAVVPGGLDQQPAVLVICPSRRCSPVLASEGTRPT
jgi:hypothetical protein